MMQSISEYLETLNEDGKNAVTALIDFMEQAAPSLHPKLSFPLLCESGSMIFVPKSREAVLMSELKSLIFWI